MSTNRPSLKIVSSHSINLLTCRDVYFVDFTRLLHSPFSSPTHPKKNKHPINLPTCRDVYFVDFTRLLHSPFFSSTHPKKNKHPINLPTCRDAYFVGFAGFSQLFRPPFSSPTRLKKNKHPIISLQTCRHAYPVGIPLVCKGRHFLGNTVKSCKTVGTGWKDCKIERHKQCNPVRELQTPPKEP
jgi:hypothetical protein